jgi:glucose-6-phosphate 1-epimerase
MIDTLASCAPHIRLIDSPLGGRVLDVRTRHSHAVIAVRGAQVLEWVPAGHAPVFWLSPLARLDTGKAVRGGVPVCWPWFGPHAESALPAHGLARTRDWSLISADASETAAVLQFALLVDDDTQPPWRGRAEARLTVSVAADLQLVLEAINRGTEPLVLTEALHSYFNVGDISAVTIAGLDGMPYADQLAGHALLHQRGDVTFEGEVDRLYADSRSSCVIADPVLGRKIRIAKSGSATTVVWNPWAQKAERLGDLGPGGYRRMVCVETANAGDAAIAIEPGETHRLAATISIESA